MLSVKKKYSICGAKELMRCHRRDYVVATVFGLLLGFSFALGQNFYSNEGHFGGALASFLLNALFFFIGSTLAFLLMFKLKNWFDNAEFCKRQGVVGNYTAPIGFVRNHFFIVTFLLFFLAWLPAFFAFYPGNYSSDMPEQLCSLFNNGILDLHWPAAHTLLVAGFFLFGKYFLGSFDAGLALFCFFQMTMLALSVSYSVCLLSKLKVRKAWTLVVSFCVAINPAVESFVVSTTKDTFFAIFFVLSLTLFCKVLCFRRIFKVTIWTYVGLVFALTGLCLMRKQGLYVAAIVFIVAVPFLQGWRAKTLLTGSLVAGLAFSSLFSIAMNYSFTTRLDSPREVLSVPSQQIVRTYMLDYASLSDEQKNSIGQFYDLEALEDGRNSNFPWLGYPGIGKYYDASTGNGYLEPVADPAKGAINEVAYRNNSRDYIQLWLLLMKEHPDLYLEAFAWGEVGYVYPTSLAANRWSGYISPWNEFTLTFDNVEADEQVSNYNDTSLLPSLRDWLVDGSSSFFAGNPCLTLAVSPALPFLVLVFASAFIIRKGCPDRSLLLVLLFPLMYWMTLSLGPVMCERYVAPLLFCVPFLACLPFADVSEV